MRNHTAHLLRRSALLGGIGLLGFSISQLLGDAAPATQPATMPAAMTAAPPTTAPAPATADIDRLINQLGSDNSDDRDAAQKQLVDAGSAAISSLKKAAATSNDPEIRSRAAAAMAQIKDHDSNDVSLITLHMKDAGTTDVLNSISAQAHAQIIGFTPGRLMNPGDRTLSVDADQKPFWDVMSDVCGQLNVCPMMDLSGRNQLRLMPAVRNWMKSPHQIVGPFWVGVAGVYRNRSIDLMGPPAIDDQFTVRLVVYPEPKLAVAQISDLSLKEAADDAGNSLISKAAPNANLAIARALGKSLGQMNRTIDSRLSYPEHPGAKIAILSGDLTVMIAQDIQPYVVDDVMGTQKVVSPMKNCNVQVTVTKQPGLNETYHVAIQCVRDGLDDDQWAALVSRTNTITLEDADGHPLTSYSYILGGSATETTYTTQAYFSRNPAVGVGAIGGLAGGLVGGAPAGAAAAPTKIGEPKRLTWNVATTLKSVKVPVSFKDLPMP